MTEDTKQDVITRTELEELLQVALDQRDEELITRVQLMIAEQIASEADVRRSEIQSVRSDIADVDSKISERLDNINGQLDGMSGTLGRVEKFIDRVSGVMSGLETIVTNVGANQRELAKRLGAAEQAREHQSAELREDIDGVQKQQVIIGQRSEATYRAVFGVAGETGPASLYETIQSLQQDLTARIGEVLSATGANRTAIDALTAREDARTAAEERERLKWQRRREAVLGVLKYVGKSRAAFAAVVGIGGALLVAVAPEVVEILEQLFTYME